MKLFGTKRNAAHYAKKRGKGRKIFLILFTLMLVLGGGVYALMTAFIRPPVPPDFRQPPRQPPSTVISPVPPEQEEPVKADRAFTVLIAGQDNVGTIGLTDTLMLATVDSANRSINVVSIPRDTLVDVNWVGRKINSVFAMTGSVHRLVDEVERVVGFRPDFYVTVDLQAFTTLVDVLEGVWFDVPVRMRYDDPYDSPPLHIHLDPGYQLLTGNQAGQLVRFRQNNDGSGYGDFGRIQTQQAFLHAVAAELLQIRNVTRIGELAGIFIDHVDTDMPIGSLIWLATQLMDMDSDNINFLLMPVEEGIWLGGVSYVALLLEEWLEMVNAYLNPTPWPVTEENVRVFTRVNGTIQLVGEGLSFSGTEEEES